MQVIQSFLRTLTFGQPRTVRNLSVVPLIRQGYGASTYRTLDAALARHTVSITELGDGGVVAELQLENRGKRPVLLVGGEELVGAKQNRVLNVSMVAPAGMTIALPVSCVEAGRWSEVSSEFGTAGRIHYASGRARMVEGERVAPTGRGRRTDQGEIWAEIAAKSTRLAAHSATGAMSAMYEQHAGTLEEYRLPIAAETDQCGAVFIVAGLLAGVELFDSAASFAALLPKLVTSYALDALDTPLAQGPASRRALARSFLSAIGAAKMQAVPAAGLGEDIRLTGTRVTGSALLFEGQCIHLSAFRRPKHVIYSPA